MEMSKAVRKFITGKQKSIAKDGWIQCSFLLMITVGIVSINNNTNKISETTFTYSDPAPARKTTRVRGSVPKIPNKTFMKSQKTDEIIKSINKNNVDSRESFTQIAFKSASQIPVFWHIPKVGGSTIKNILASCYGKIIADEVGTKNGHHADTALQIIHGDGKGQFVNVDTTTASGIERAKRMNLVESGLTEIIISPLLNEVTTLFENHSNKQGIVFSVFRHPIDRAVSMYNYLQYAEWEPTYTPELKSMTLTDYARSIYVENNFLTRRISNSQTGELTEKHLQEAKTFVREKILVGLVSKLDESMDRFERFFRWRLESFDDEKCRESQLQVGGNVNPNKQKVKIPLEGTEAHDLLLKQNMLDISLYKYVEELFVEQEALVADTAKNFRLSEATSVSI